ncbi:MAG TPA: hypothetical protein ENH41_01205 [Candidatus Omnitrophica bacterium]|nr:hypothetical protein [Candidatus Omnitrophota bacterium]
MNKLSVLIIFVLIVVGVGTFFVLGESTFAVAQLDYEGYREDVILNRNNSFETEDVIVTLKSDYGYGLRVRYVRPKLSRYPAKRFPAVFRISGGWGTGLFLLDAEAARKAAAKGLIVAAYESSIKKRYPLGSSKRDYNGFKDQDDAAVVLGSIFNNLQVDPNMVGVWSNSNGITIASGFLGREKYKELSKKVVFLLDAEGPHNPEYILKNTDDIDFRDEKRMISSWKKVINAKVGPGKDYSTEEEFFKERCAINFIGNFKGIYRRGQARNDHALTSYHGHAVAMLNAAAQGKARWARLNREPKNQIYWSSQEPDGVDIDSVIDVKQFKGPNDKRFWDVLFKLFNQLY